MIGINDIKDVRVTTPDINFEKDIGADYFQNLEFSDKYPAIVTIHQEKPAVDVPLHWHAGGELIYSRNWNMLIIIDGIQHNIHSGEFILISPYALHAVYPEQSEREMEILSVTFNMKDVGRVDSNVQYCKMSRDAPGSTDEMRENMLLLCEKLYEEVDKNSGDNSFRINSLLFELIQQILDNFWVRDDLGPQKVEKRENKLKDVMMYISENYRENLSTYSVAEYFGYTREHFCKIFKKYSNMTFKEHLTQVRLDAVVKMMRQSDENCTRIALSQGFPDIKGFVRAFKKRYGMNPNQYRKKFIDGKK